MKLKIALVIAAIALLCVVGWSSKAESSSRDQWEYKLVTKYRYHDVSPQNVTEFNDLGSDGWELVTVLSEDVVRGNHRQIKVSYYFKRRN
jgi:hypothetical protein